MEHFSNIIRFVKSLTSSTSPKERIEVRVQDLENQSFRSTKEPVTYVPEHMLPSKWDP